MKSSCIRCLESGLSKSAIVISRTSVNKFAQLIIKWTKACDKRLCRLISYIHHTCDVENNADWDCFKVPILQEILRIQILHQVEHCAFLEVTCLFQWVGCVRNKFQFRTVSTEWESISLDAGLRMDGIPTIDFGDLIFEILGNTNQSNRVRRDLCTNQREVRSTLHNLLEWWMIFSSLKRKFFHQEVLFVVRVSRPRSSDQDDFQGKKPDNETCF